MFTLIEFSSLNPARFVTNEAFEWRPSQTEMPTLPLSRSHCIKTSRSTSAIQSTFAETHQSTGKRVKDFHKKSSEITTLQGSTRKSVKISENEQYDKRQSRSPNRTLNMGNEWNTFIKIYCMLLWGSCMCAYARKKKEEKRR